ncbi:MAG: NAD-dependent epimerase/dehydratase family protein [Oscillospiraceae bacterium]|nr:NAD-dependent epimerase/dehydratase family protein [Oscillospiraceae bacterium]
MKSKNVLVTGAAGFIGFHTAKRLLMTGISVAGFDNLCDYYDVSLKEARLHELESAAKPQNTSEPPVFTFIRADLADKAALEKTFNEHKPDAVIHLGAQAGVRYSIDNPDIYVRSNLVGFVNILECCRRFETKHLLYASSSSVYGSNEKQPFSVNDRTDNPISLYAATKKSNELMAYTYAHLYGIPITGMRFFTVYGPWGRPDMAPMLFMDAIYNGKPLKVFNNGDMKRDFTYVDDAVDSIVALIDKSAAMFAENIPYKLYNIGNNRPEKLLDFIALLEEYSGKKAIKEMHPLQPGDVKETYADIGELIRDTGAAPKTPLGEGLKDFVKWWIGYYA